MFESVCECGVVSVFECGVACVCKYVRLCVCPVHSLVCCTSSRVKVDLANSNNSSILSIIAVYMNVLISKGFLISS